MVKKNWLQCAVFLAGISIKILDNKIIIQNI